MKKILSILILTILIKYNYAQNYVHVNIIANDKQLNELVKNGICIDHGKHKNGFSIETDIKENELEILNSIGIQYSLIHNNSTEYYLEKMNNQSVFKSPGSCDNGAYSYIDPVHFELGSMGGYLTYNEIMSELDSMFMLYPSLVKQKAQIGSFLTHESRTIDWLKISDNPGIDENEPEILITALHHAREPASVSQLIFFIWYLLENYGTNPEITYLIDNTEIYLVPVVNPDGYVYNETTDPSGGGMWRKNRRNNGDGTYGVDLNRNYSYQWGVSGTSTTTSSDVYLGPSAFSEPETQAIKDLVLNHDFKIALNYHTYSNLLLFPYGYDYIDAPDKPYFDVLTAYMVEENHYTNETAVTLYPASGDSDDWMYGDTIVKPRFFPMTPEVGADAFGFWPPTSEIIPICYSTVHQNLTALRALHYYIRTNEYGNILIPSSSLNPYITYETNKIGLADTGTTTVSFIPLTSNISSVGAPKTYTNLVGFLQFNDSIQLNLSPSIVQGDIIQFIVKTQNPFGTNNDTITKYFGDPSTIFITDFTTLSSITATVWGLTTSEFVSPNSSMTDSPGSNYSINANNNFFTTQISIPSTAVFAQLKFNAKWAIEDGYDYAQVLISTDNGITYTPLCGKYTNSGTADQILGSPLYDGTQLTWVMEEINLNAYIGMDVIIKFTFKSDVGVQMDGIYIDDLELEIIDPNSVKEIDVKNLFSVFPNPANDQLYITNLLKENCSFQITNESGQKIMNGKLSGEKSDINIQNLTNGIYFLHINLDKKTTAHFKIAIVH